VLYRKLLPRDFDLMPAALRAFHSAPGGGSATGTVEVRRETGWLARLIGFPPTGRGIPLRLQVIAKDDQEVWIRRFGEVVLQSRQRREGELLVESMGPVRIFFRIFADRTGMRFQSQRARLWILPIPFRVEAQVWGTDSSWDFRVAVAGGGWDIGWYRGAVAPAR
jgi:hypothetical protein